jgi:hypothetical protein
MVSRDDQGRGNRLRSLAPHLWVFMPPVAAVVIGYVLWFLLMAILRAPDWLARLWHSGR